MPSQLSRLSEVGHVSEVSQLCKVRHVSEVSQLSMVGHVSEVPVPVPVPKECKIKCCSTVLMLQGLVCYLFFSMAADDVSLFLSL